MVRSSVLGGKVLTRLNNAGNKSSTVFDVDGLLKVVQSAGPYGSSLSWTHIDPFGLSEAGDTKAVYDPIGITFNGSMRQLILLRARFLLSPPATVDWDPRLDMP